jgi:hypothetical protein
MSVEFIKKIEPKFYCEICDYSCRYLSDWTKHNNTIKHISNNPQSNIAKIEQGFKTQSQFTCSCNKIYKSYSGLWRHSKNCNKNINNKIYNNNENIVVTNATSIDNNDLKQIVLDIVKSNSELQKQNIELQKQVLDICKNIHPSVNNNTILNNCNNNNKTFNLQVFLNETCKDAMNISEFIENISLQLSDLENIGKLGYVDGVSNIIIKNLNALEVEKRPMHCTDKKREIVYVKDDDEWQKEQEDKKHIKSVISSVISKNLQLLPEYENKYPECMNPESKKSDEYNKIIMETMGGGIHANGEKNKEKIIRKIAKKVVINKE